MSQSGLNGVLLKAIGMRLVLLNSKPKLFFKMSIYECGRPFCFMPVGSNIV